MTDEQRILEKSGYYSEDFARLTIKILQHFSIEELCAIHEEVASMKSAGGDPIEILRAAVN